jgi:hypothetical protein
MNLLDEIQIRREVYEGPFGYLYDCHWGGHKTEKPSPGVNSLRQETYDSENPLPEESD